jgi:hypothetical protein
MLTAASGTVNVLRRWRLADDITHAFRYPRHCQAAIRKGAHPVLGDERSE